LGTFYPQTALLGMAGFIFDPHKMWGLHGVAELRKQQTFLPESSHRSYWSMAEPCDIRQRTFIGQQAEKPATCFHLATGESLRGFSGSHTQ